MDIIFEQSFASHIKSKYWSNANNKNPKDIYLNSRDKYIFNCEECGHSFKMSIYDICRNRWCKYCANQSLCNDINCIYCYNKSFASHWRSWWLKDYDAINPITIFKNSNKKYSFNCTECNHTFITKINDISRGNWCKYCSNQELCNDTDCKYCYNNSFMNSSYLSLWSKKNKIDPRNIFKYSHTKYLFTCNKCNHDFECSPSNINYGKGCSYCANKRLCINNDCEICYNKSFASCEKSKYWSQKNKISPRYIFKYTNKKYIFNCYKCNNEFSISINNINSNNRWCGKCRNKTEKKLLDILQKTFNIIAHPQYIWCKNPKTNRYLPFDFECNNKIIIELDGLQHYKQIYNWKKPEEQRDIDKYKMKCALSNDKHIIRIFQEDVYYDKNNWKDKLFNTIDELLLEKIPTIKYINIDPKYFND
jgi:hypothetical protein